MGTDFVVTIRHARHRICVLCVGGWRGNPSCCGWVRKRCCTRSWTGWSMTMGRWWPDWRRTSTRSKPSCSAATRVSRRIYQLSREVIEFQRACNPLEQMLQALIAGFDKYHVDVELQRLLRDVHDHAIRVVERADAYGQLLESIADGERCPGWAAAERGMPNVSPRQVWRKTRRSKRYRRGPPSCSLQPLIGTVYGMNFDHMPELNWVLGYPFALGLMLMVSVVLYTVFKLRRWL